MSERETRQDTPRQPGSDERAGVFSAIVSGILLMAGLVAVMAAVCLHSIEYTS